MSTVEATEIIVRIPAERALEYFIKEEAIDPILEHIRREIDEFEGDASTPRGRREIASMAYKVAQSKAYLEGIGKRLADEQKEIPKKIDATRRRIKETLDDWRDEVRAPLTRWEEAENARVEKHKRSINWLKSLVPPHDWLGNDRTAARVEQELERVKEIDPGEWCEEFLKDYVVARKNAHESLTRLHAGLVQYEAEQQALREAAAAAAEREAARKQEEMAAAAAERAKKQAEADAQAAIDAANKRAEEAELRAARAKKLAEQEAEARAAQEKAEEEKREANRRHRAAVHRKALAAFIAYGIDEAPARAAIEVIAKGGVPGIRITY